MSRRSPRYVRGGDGKLYPAAHQPDRIELIALAHSLRHREALSIRGIVARLETDRGVHRSVGSVSAWLTAWRCADCSGGGIPHLNSAAGPDAS